MNRPECQQHSAHLRRGANVYGWVARLDDWEQCASGKGRPLPVRRKVDSVFLSVAEVAAIMRVSKMTVYRLVHAGDLPAVRIGRSFRVPEKAVIEFLERVEYEAGGAA